MKKYLAEAYGAGIYTLLGCATAMVGVRYFGNLGIALTFCIAAMAMYYSLAPISGAHLNPAITIAHASSGRMKWIEAWKYMIAQMVGATIASLLLYAIAIGTVGPDNVAFLGQNAVKNGYLMQVAFVTEFIATLILVKVFLATTGSKHSTEMAGLVIGLTIVMLHFMTMPITGTSLNPARSVGPALFLGGEHLKEVWLFVAAPLLAGLVGGACHKWFEKMK